MQYKGLIILMFLGFYNIGAQIKAISPKEQLYVAKPFTLIYELSTIENIEFPPVQKGMILSPDLEVVDITIDTLFDRGKIHWKLELIAFDSAIYTIPAHTFKIAKQRLQAESVTIKVDRLPPEKLQAPHYDIKPIKEVVYTWSDYLYNYRWVVLVLVICIVIGLIIWRYRQIQYKRKDLQLSPGEEAFDCLAELEKQKAWEKNVGSYYMAITNIIRSYLDGKWAIEAKESTSEEILKKVKARLDEKHQEVLKNILQEADAVKFAKDTPNLEQRINILHEIKNWVTYLETLVDYEPKPLPELNLKHFEALGERVVEYPANACFVWWETQDEQRYTASNTQKMWNLFYEKYITYIPCILGALAREKELSSSGREIHLGLENQQWAFVHRDIGHYILCFSQHEGLILKFDPLHTSKEAANHCIELFLQSIQSLVNDLPPKIASEYSRSDKFASIKLRYEQTKVMIDANEKNNDLKSTLEGLII